MFFLLLLLPLGPEVGVEAVFAFEDSAIAGGAGGILGGDEEIGIFFDGFGEDIARWIGGRFRRWDGVNGIGGFIGLGRGFGVSVVAFVELFELAEFALETAFSGVFVAQEAVVHGDLFRLPGKGGAGDAVDEEIEFGLRTNAVPFGLRGFEDKEKKKSVFDGVVDFTPFFQEQIEGFLVFVGQNESVGVGAELDFLLRSGRLRRVLLNGSGLIEMFGVGKHNFLLPS